jgi:hypothetical protein
LKPIVPVLHGVTAKEDGTAGISWLTVPDSAVGPVNSKLSLSVVSAPIIGSWRFSPPCFSLPM